MNDTVAVMASALGFELARKAVEGGQLRAIDCRLTAWIKADDRVLIAREGAVERARTNNSPLGLYPSLRLDEYTPPRGDHGPVALFFLLTVEEALDASLHPVWFDDSSGHFAGSIGNKIRERVGGDA